MVRLLNKIEEKGTKIEFGVFPEHPFQVLKKVRVVTNTRKK